MVGRHFLTLSDFSKDELSRLIALARTLKQQQKDGVEHKLLQGKIMAMIFQKPSTRTRVSFETGILQLGGAAVTLRPEEIDMGKREPIPDVSRVMSRYVDVVVMRVISHADLSEFARCSSVPVVNGLSDLYHPCQALADIMTVAEFKGGLNGLKVCYVGDGNNVCNSLIDIASKFGLQMVVCCPEGYDPLLSPENGGYEIIREPEEAVRGADVVYTDVWTSMGQESETERRLRAFSGYTVTAKLLARAKKDVLFMHCLPAHRGEEVEDEVVEGDRSVVFEQAENRLHAQKAVLAHLLRSDL